MSTVCKFGPDTITLVTIVQCFYPFCLMFSLLIRVWCVYALLCFGLSATQWLNHWLVDFWVMTTPIALVGLLIFLFWALFYKHKLPLLFWLTVLLAWPATRKTFAWYNATPVESPASISLLSYNTMFFNYYPYAEKEDTETTPQMLHWLSRQNPDIFCFQEFYNGKGLFQTKQLLQNMGYPHYRLLKNPSQKQGVGFVGVALFSKFPIIDSEQAFFSTMGNGYIWADIQTPNMGKIRVLNIHLQSMGIRVNKLLNERDYQEAKAETRSIARLLKIGFEKRRKEVKTIEKLLANSPYPTLLCGDFNETPYGYAYSTFGKYLANAFEKKGLGFGFTYNRNPAFIRIDNHFFDENWFNILSFRVGSEKYSDHYPVWSKYGKK